MYSTIYIGWSYHLFKGGEGKCPENMHSIDVNGSKNIKQIDGNF